MTDYVTRQMLLEFPPARGWLWFATRGSTGERRSITGRGAHHETPH